MKNPNDRPMNASDHRECAALCRVEATDADKQGRTAFADRCRAGALYHERLANMTAFGRLLAETATK